MADVTRTVAVDVDDRGEPPARGFSWPWPVLAAVGAAGVALMGWVILAGASTIAWLGDGDAGFVEMLRLATSVFALAHGVPTDIAGQHVSLVPLGLTGVLMFLSLPVVSASARRAAVVEGKEGADGAVHVDVETMLWKVAGLHAVIYAVTVAILDGALLGGSVGARSLLGGLVIGLIAGLWGAANGLNHDPTMHWPEWLQAVPRAMGATLIVVMTGGLVAVGIAVFAGRARIVDVASGLGIDASGVIALSVLHLLYLPNLMLWACSWILGAGITFGDGSLVSLHITDVGLLPALPVLGAVPQPGLMPKAMLWWLVVGVVAGALAGLVVAWARPRARFDETAVAGGLAGIVAGLLLTLLASLASGGIGVDRLAHIGARVDQLIIFAPVLLGLSGLAAGLILGLIRRPGGATGDVRPRTRLTLVEETTGIVKGDA
ncbi:DUF6350 family protein [uncultured Tessaracoccus sp.]|uniref:cell division protein PerM n=1 Tax=uncultured Tessaracoccus sp. TaxID=905023 RepID=UPI0026139E29|nr:DUF6350 family protein [uncultured Tessaracoccus sp.]